METLFILAIVAGLFYIVFSVIRCAGQDTQMANKKHQKRRHNVIRSSKKHVAINGFVWPTNTEYTEN